MNELSGFAWLFRLMVFVFCVGCAPAVLNSKFEAVLAQGHLAVNERGEIAWITAGHIFIARPPDFAVHEVPTPAVVSSLAWRDGELWCAFPATGMVVSVTGVPRSVHVVAPARLSTQLTVASSGEVLGEGVLLGRLPALPSSVLEQRGSTLHAWVIADRDLYEVLPDRLVRQGRIPDEISNPTLIEEGSGYRIVNGPAVALSGVEYRFRDRDLEAVVAGRVIARRSIGSVSAIAAGRWNVNEFIAVLVVDHVELYRARTLELMQILNTRTGGRS